MSVKGEIAEQSASVQPDRDTGNVDLGEEDLARAYVYRMLACFLAAPPTKSDLTAIGNGEANSTEFGRAYEVFANLCKQTDPTALKAEYHDLFIGVGRGELLPYASYYLTGFLNEKPLAKLRNDLAELGIERASSNKDPEDHIAAVLEVMAGLIVGDYSTPASLEDQKKFFQNHISPWSQHFFEDLASAKSSVFYALLAELGKKFMEIEETAFQMVD